MNRYTTTDRFLFALSTVQSLYMWDHAFNSAYLHFYQTNFNLDTNYDYFSWLSNLEDLGFVSISLEKRKVFIEKPFFCRLPNNRKIVVVCGARTSHFLLNLRTSCEKLKLAYDEQFPNDQKSPTRIVIQGDFSAIQELSNEFKIPISSDPYSYLIATTKIRTSDFVSEEIMKEKGLVEQQFNCITDLVTSIRPSFSLAANEFIEDMLFFNPSTLKYDSSIPPKVARYALYKRQLYDTTHVILTFDDSTDKYWFFPSVEKKFGKYFELAEDRKQLCYNRKDNIFYVPKYCPLPPIYSRALGCCSCLCPIEKKMKGEELKIMGFSDGELEVLAYQDVPEVIVKIICDSLNIKYFCIPLS